jgi:hypothetical protein
LCADKSYNQYTNPLFFLSDLYEPKLHVTGMEDESEDAAGIDEISGEIGSNAVVTFVCVLCMSAKLEWLQTT